MQGTGVCVARAPYGVRCHPCPLENLGISPLRLLHCFRGSHPLRTRARQLCARSAASPAAQIPPSAEPRHLVVYRIRSGPVLAGDSFQYQGCRASTFPSRACPDTSSLMSSTQLRRACLPVRVVCAAARREARQSELPRDFCPTLPPWRAFCSPVWFGELRRFTKSEANITTILTANLPFMFTHRGFPLSIIPARHWRAWGGEAVRAGINDRKTSLPFIASGFALRFYLLCDGWWVQVVLGIT